MAGWLQGRQGPWGPPHGAPLWGPPYTEPPLRALTSPRCDPGAPGFWLRLSGLGLLLGLSGLDFGLDFLDSRLILSWLDLILILDLNFILILAGF